MSGNLSYDLVSLVTAVSSINTRSISNDSKSLNKLSLVVTNVSFGTEE